MVRAERKGKASICACPHGFKRRSLHQLPLALGTGAPNGIRIPKDYRMGLAMRRFLLGNPGLRTSPGKYSCFANTPGEQCAALMLPLAARPGR